MLLYLMPIAILLLLLLLTVFVLLYTSGLFVGVTVERKQPPLLGGEVTLAYKIHTGSYNEAGYLFTEAYALNSKYVQCGVRSVSANLSENVAGPESEPEPEPERSAIGAILPSGTEADASDIFVKAGFQLARLPRVTDSLVATFPHVSFLSVAIGSRRLFNCMVNYVKENELKVNTLLELYDGQFIHCVGLFDKDDAQFRQLIERSSSASENVIEEKIEPVDILGPTVKTNEPNTELKLESVETIPKREESFPVMVSLADVEQQDMIGNAHDNRNDTGDADEDDSLDESFEKVSPEPLID
ncbi:hypothetical protein D915_003067 [Fasciola hepatica]|uniref:Testis-expressed sequence 264 protein n=1 Tax=Fasciola hepatica TaxID=6192 RepID=A0A4E0R5J6_FASHE|nr:hypothetical protein D915_003067 [Fasciola hepatica]